MKRFEAKKSAIEIEVVTFNGEELTLTNNQPLSGDYSKKVIKHWRALESNFSNDTDDFDETKIDVIAKQLAFIFGRDADWFLTSFDLVTLNEMLMHVVTLMSGAEKKDGS